MKKKIEELWKSVDKQRLKNVGLIALAGALIIGSLTYLLIAVFSPEEDKNNDLNAGVRSGRNSDSKLNTFYHIDVYSFVDSNGDGIGDFKGIYSKLDYIKELGVSSILLSPIQAEHTEKGLSVKDYYKVWDKYEVDEYKFDELVEDFAKAGISTYMDLIIRNTSNECEWFKEGFNAYKNGKDSPYKYYYNFSMNNFEYSGKKFITRQQDSIFYESTDTAMDLPDINFDNHDVISEIDKILKYWNDIGVKGFNFLELDKISTQSDTRNDIVAELCSKVKTRDSKVFLMCEIDNANSKSNDYYLAGIDSVFTQTAKEKVESEFEGLTGYSNWVQHNQGKIKSTNQVGVPNYRTTDNDYKRIGTSLNKELLKSVAAMTILTPGDSFIYYGEELGLADENIKDKFDENKDIYKYYQDVIKLKEKYSDIWGGTVTSLMNNSAYISALLLTCENKEYMIIHNISADKAQITIDDSNLKLENGAWVVPGDEEPKLKDGKLTLPGFSSVIITVTNISKVDINCLYVDKVKEKYYIAYDDENWAINKDNEMKELEDGIYGISKEMKKGDIVSISTIVNRFGYNNIIYGGYSDSIGVNANDYYSFKIDSNGTYSFLITDMNDRFMVFASDSIDDEQIKLLKSEAKGSSKFYFTGEFLDWKSLSDGLFKYDGEKDLYYYNVTISTTNKIKMTKNKIWYGYANLKRECRNMCSFDTEFGNLLLNAGTYCIYIDEKDETMTIEKK